MEDKRSEARRDTLVVVSNVGARRADGTLFLDRKFATGMEAYAALWPGPVCCVLPQAKESGPFAATFDQDKLSFAVHLVDPGRGLAPPEEGLAAAAVVLASGDAAQGIALVAAVTASGAKLVYTIENTLKTRLQILFLEGGSLAHRMKEVLAALYLEVRRRRAFGRADGLQANGYPAWRAYGAGHASGMSYLDGRVTEALLVTEAEQAARAERVASDAPLRLVHSGRLEPIKGALDLVDLARYLKARRVPFTLDIFGTGSLEAEMAEGFAALNLDDRVRFHGALDFETELIPRLRRESDLFVSCHRQSDPSCTYLETFGCGIPVVGYANAMLTPLADASGAAEVVPMADTHALAERIAALNADRARLAALSEQAAAFAAAHSFEAEFRRRIEHLAGVAGLALSDG
ncbi:MAG: glycosyltransferase [Pseudomonadota bacterium]